MRRWDRLLDSYIEEYRARGVCAESVAMNARSARSLGTMAQGVAAACEHRAHRCGFDHAIRRELFDIQGEGDGVWDLEHDARIRRLLGTPRSLDDKSIALDEGTEGHPV
jgi:hypothetical protein